MNNITAANNTALATNQRNAFEQYAEAVNQNRIVGELLKFSKGEYLYGKDSDELPLKTQLIANVPEMMIGWLKWHDNKPIDMKMGKVIEGFIPPKRSELGDTDEGEWDVDEQTDKPRDPWQLTNYVIFKAVGGDQLYSFSTASKGGISAVGVLAGEYGKRMRSRPDDLPIVSLDRRSYMHSVKAYGKIYVPEFKVIDWTDRADFDAALKAESAASEEDDAFKASDSQKEKLKAKGDAMRKSSSEDVVPF